MLEAAGIQEDKQTDSLVALDKLDKIGTDGVVGEMLKRGIHEESINKILELFKKINSLSENAEILDALEDFVGENEFGRLGCKDLGEILGFAKDLPIKIDASLARGLSYYTGAIMEVDVGKEIGSLGGGGRYDGLIGMFGKEQIPACGFSLGLERILVVMEERGMFPPEIAAANSADVMVTIWNEDSVADSLALARELRAQGLRVLLYPEADKMGKQFKYAGQINVPYVVVQGDEEKAAGMVALKNMQSGEQETVKREDVAKSIKAA
jgi:histidyl-tRNA synthetase